MTKLLCYSCYWSVNEIHKMQIHVGPRVTIQGIIQIVLQQNVTWRLPVYALYRSDIDVLTSTLPSARLTSCVDCSFIVYTGTTANDLSNGNRLVTTSAWLVLCAEWKSPIYGKDHICPYSNTFPILASECISYVTLYSKYLQVSIQSSFISKLLPVTLHKTNNMAP